MFEPTMQNYNNSLFAVSILVFIIMITIQISNLIESPFVGLSAIPVFIFVLMNRNSEIDETFIINYIDDIYYKSNIEQPFFHTLRKIYSITPFLDLFFSFI